MEWIEIVEPKTRQCMFANLKTGECSWDPPLNEPIKRMQENQWWELYDSKSHRFYYYNPTSSETVWGKPADCDIIPLAKLQLLKENTGGGTVKLIERPSKCNSEAGSPARSTSLRRHTPCADRYDGQRPYDNLNCVELSNHLPNGGAAGRDFSPRRLQSSHASYRHPYTESPLAKGMSRVLNSAFAGTTSPKTPKFSSKTERNSPPPAGALTGFTSYSYSHSSSQSSLGAHSSELLSQATQYSVASTATAGAPSPPNEKRLTAERMEPSSSASGWTRDGLKAPLTSGISEKKLRKEALKSFKLIQQYCGDRKAKGTSDHIVVLILEAACRNKPELSDELFLQITKQLTDNPKSDSLRKGWELLGICVGFLTPASEEVRRRVIAFMEQYTDPLLDSPEVSASQYAKHCVKKLDRPHQAAAKPSVSLETVRQARYAIFYPSKFGASLEDQMEMQAHEFPSLAIPWVEYTLIKLILDCEHTEGLFRIASDQDQMNAAMVQLEVWVRPTVKDCHVPASLLKQWLRQIPTPLIPNEMYAQCLASSTHPESCCQLVNSLPEINRLTLAALLLLLQRLAAEEVVKHTRMDVSNLAMIIAPNLLRCESDDPATIFANSRCEMEFVKQIIINFDTSFLQHII